MRGIWSHFDDWTADPDRLADRTLNNLTDHQLYQRANDLLAAQAIMREFEAEWYGRRGVLAPASRS